MKISNAFPSNYLRAADFEAPAKLVMTKVEIEPVADGEHKPILYFQGKDKGMVLNKINSNTISDAYGDDTEDWMGKELVLYATTTDYQGKTVPCIRVRKPKPPGTTKPAPKQSENPMDDEVPF